jgi:ADP-heptose:LPS heptosyltransferase
MTDHELINQGNTLRAQHQPQAALRCYAQAFIDNPENAAAWNNYGNVMRECGEPARAIPFLQHATVLEPNHTTALFNLAVAYLAQGDWTRGWQYYEHRWNFEHLAGTLPKFEQPRWTGQDLSGKRLLVIGEQGHGDNIQFVRYLYNLHVAGAKITFATTDGLIPLFSSGSVIERVVGYNNVPTDFDFWVPLMSIPGVLGLTLENIPSSISYITVDQDRYQQWLQTLGPKNRMRIGFAWSGRRDNWLNEHKGMPFEKMLAMIQAHPQHEWINLQIDATPEQEAELEAAGVRRFPGAIQDFRDTAALVSHMDVVVTVDTAVAHLAGALGRPTWIMLNWFAPCWRWLTKREDSPWYSTARLFRQPQQDDWNSVIKKVSQYLSWFKV